MRHGLYSWLGASALEPGERPIVFHALASESLIFAYGFRVAVKELQLSYYRGGTVSVTICTHYGKP